MKYLAGVPYKQINRVYLYNYNTSKVHIHGEFRDYLIKNNIHYLNIAVEDNIVYFIPCFSDEYNKINKLVKLTDVKNNKSMSFNCKKLFNYFNIIVKKSIKKNKESEGHNLNYFLIDMDQNRKGIYFKIPKEIMGVESINTSINKLSEENNFKENIKIKLKEIEEILDNI
jgi:hypothetical protein